MTEERRRLVVPPQGSPCGGATPVVVVAIMGVSWRGSWRPDSCAAPAGTRRSSLSSSPTGTRAMHGTMRARVYDRDHLDHYDLDLLGVARRRPHPPPPSSSSTRGRRCASSRGGAADRDAEDVNGSLGPAAPSPTVRRGVVRRWRRSSSSSRTTTSAAWPT